jgi:hypothetical protein
MAPAPSLEQLIHEVERDAPDAEPLSRLRTAATMLEVITSTTDAVLGYFVDQARRSGHSWAEIGASLGVTKQAAQQRQLSRTTTLGVGPATFERFTVKARNVVSAAKSVADDLGHNFIGTEHLLLALYTEPDSIGAQVLVEIGLPQKAAQSAVLQLIPRGTDAIDFAPFTPRAMSMFSTALGVALELGHNYIGTEHLLLALAKSDGVAARVLSDAGASYDDLAALVIEKLSGYVAKEKPPQKRAAAKRAAKKTTTARRRKT